MSEAQDALERLRDQASLISAEMSLRPQGSEASGDTQVPSGDWFTLVDAMAWHEAGHAIAFAALDWIVELITIDPARSLSEGQGSCTAVPRVLPEQRTIVAVRAIASCAGTVGPRLVLTGLGLEDMKTDVTVMSPSDSRVVEEASRLLRGKSSTPAFITECYQEAVKLLVQHRVLYGALVAALVERRTLEQHEIQIVLSGACLPPS